MFNPWPENRSAVYPFCSNQQPRKWRPGVTYQRLRYREESSRRDTPRRRPRQAKAGPFRNQAFPCWGEAGFTDGLIVEEREDLVFPDRGPPTLPQTAELVVCLSSPDAGIH